MSGMHELHRVPVPTATHRTSADDALPAAYRILPASVDFCVPDFHAHYRDGDQTLAPRPRDAGEWFDAFVDRIAQACGREFLPVCRISDGEFRFLLGDQPPDVRLPRARRLAIRLRSRLARLRHRGRFRAQTLRTVSSGVFTAAEWRAERARYGGLLGTLAERGMLAIHLSYGQNRPFQEHFFPALGEWLRRHEIVLDDRNYVPFYFVYAALTGPRRAEWLRGRRILVVHGSTGDRKRRIQERLRELGAAKVEWCAISADRAYYDVVDTAAFRGRVDLALVGAGVGKPNVLLQLEPLGVPCIDAGYVFEVWAEDDRKWERPFCVPDTDWDADRVRFGGLQGIADATRHGWFFPRAGQ
jgi:hypothetical protein